MTVPVIGVEGLLGIGKTTFCREVAKRVNGVVIEEPVDANPFLAKFYEELRQGKEGFMPVQATQKLMQGVIPNLKVGIKEDEFFVADLDVAADAVAQHGGAGAITLLLNKFMLGASNVHARYPWHLPFVMQIFLLHYRYATKQTAMHLAQTRNPPQGPIFLDRTIWGDLNFESLLYKGEFISKEQHDCYKFCFEVMRNGLRFPTHVIYLYTSPETAYRRMKERNRDVEVGVEMEYLQSLHDEYEKMYGDMLAGRIIGARGAHLERVNYNADFDVQEGTGFDQLADMVKVMAA